MDATIYAYNTPPGPLKPSRMVLPFRHKIKPLASKIDKASRTHYRQELPTTSQANVSRNAKKREFNKANQREATCRVSVSSAFKERWQNIARKPNKHDRGPGTESGSTVNLSGCPSQNFASLIREAILHSPSLTRSAKGICKDIMGSHDWYKLNCRSGWQEMVAEELIHNPLFQPILVCRNGVIVSNKKMEWQFVGQTAPDFSTNAPPQNGTHSIVRSPLSLSAPVVELHATPASTARSTKTTDIPQAQVREAAESNLQFSTTELPITASIPTTRSPPPHYSAIEYTDSDFASVIERLNKSKMSLESGHKTTALPLKPRTSGMTSTTMDEDINATIDTPVSRESDSIAEDRTKSIEVNLRRAPEVRRVQLYDPPLDEESYYQRAPNDGSDPQPSSPSSSSRNQSSDTKARTKSFPSHRKHLKSKKGTPDESDHGEGSSDDDDDEQRRKRKRFRSPTRNRRELACVYHKYDPNTYGIQQRKYLVCAGTGFKYISELLRHLERNHGEYVCRKCLRIFESSDLRKDHKDVCLADSYRQSQEDLWRELWQARFPSSPIPETPYLETSGRPSLSPIKTRLELPPENSERRFYSPSPNGSISSAATLIDVSPSHARLAQHPLATSRINEHMQGLYMQFSANPEMIERRISRLEKQVSALEETVRSLRVTIANIQTMKPNANHTSATTREEINHLHTNDPRFYNSAPNFTDTSSWSVPGCETSSTFDSQPHCDQTNHQLPDSDSYLLGLENPNNSLDLDGRPSLQVVDRADLVLPDILLQDWDLQI